MNAVAKLSTFLLELLKDRQVQATIIGVVVALAATWATEWWRSKRRRQRIASAFVIELRGIQRQIEEARSAAEKRVFAITAGFSDQLYSSLLSEISDVGPEVFQRLRWTYLQLRQVDFLNRRLQAQLPKGSTRIPAEALESGLTDAFIASCTAAGDFVEAALAALRPLSGRKAFSHELPERSRYYTADEAAVLGLVAEKEFSRESVLVVDSQPKKS